MRTFRPILLPLEPRELLSSLPAAPTNEEQYMLQLINRARANPAAEGQRLLSLAQTDPVLKTAVKGWDLSAFIQQISAIAPQPPLAFNTRLIAAANDQNAAMLAANDQRHAPAGFMVTGASGLVAGDGQPYYPVGNSSWATGENLFAYSQNVNRSTLKDYIDYFEAGFLLDWGNPDFGHLKNILAPGPSQATARGQLPFSEIGISVLSGNPTTPPPSNPENPANRGLNVGPVLLTQEFGWRSGSSFLTGTVYRDTDSNGFYTPGEGLGGVQVQAVGQHGEGTFQVLTWDSGGYSLGLPPGTYTVTIGGTNAPARSGVITIGQDNVGFDVQYDAGAVADQPVPGDYDGDGKADVAVYRASTGQWLISGSSTGPRTVSFGLPGVDIPVPGDYDGDGKTDIAVYRPTTGQWSILGSSTGLRVVTLGAPGLDTPVPGDYDGDGKTDPAVYRASTGVWSLLQSKAGARGLQFGQSGDIPVPADFDGDHKTDFAVYRPSTAQWLILGTNSASRVVQFGQAGVDMPVPADYDGDGRADLAVYRPSTSQWFIQGSATGPRAASFGQAGVDVPVPADYDGDHRADLALFRPTSAQWFENRTRQGPFSVSFGQGGRSQLLPNLPPAAETSSAVATGPTRPAPRGPLKKPKKSGKNVHSKKYHGTG